MFSSFFNYTSKKDAQFEEEKIKSGMERTISFYSLDQYVAYRGNVVGLGGRKGDSVNKFIPFKNNLELKTPEFKTVVKEVHVDIDAYQEMFEGETMTELEVDFVNLTREAELNRAYRRIGALDIHIRIGNSQKFERVSSFLDFQQKFNNIQSQGKKQEIIFYILMEQLPESIDKTYTTYKPESCYQFKEFKDFLKFYIAILKEVQRLHVVYKIVHGDLKEWNICCDEKGNIFLCDFGLARKLKDYTEDSKTELTSGFSFNNTPHLDPVLNGKKIPADPRQDVYSLGSFLERIVYDYAPYWENFQLNSKNRNFLLKLSSSMKKDNDRRISLNDAIISCVDKYNTLTQTSEHISYDIDTSAPLKKPLEQKEKNLDTIVSKKEKSTTTADLPIEVTSLSTGTISDGVSDTIKSMNSTAIIYNKTGIPSSVQLVQSMDDKNNLSNKPISSTETYIPTVSSVTVQHQTNIGSIYRV